MKIFQYLFCLVFISSFLNTSVYATMDPDTEKFGFTVEQDKFIKKMVEHLNSNAISYDGKKLVLYADPSMLSVLAEAAAACLSMFLGVKCFSSKNNDLNLISIIFVPLICFFVARFVYKLKLYSNYISVVTIDSEGICIENFLKIRWQDVLNISCEYCYNAREKYFIYLYDKDNKILNKIDSDKNFISLPFSYLIKIIECCIDASMEKEVKKKELIKNIKSPTNNVSEKTNISIESEMASPIKQWLNEIKKVWVSRVSLFLIKLIQERK